MSYPLYRHKHKLYSLLISQCKPILQTEDDSVALRLECEDVQANLILHCLHMANYLAKLEFKNAYYNGRVMEKKTLIYSDFLYKFAIFCQVHYQELICLKV